MEKISKTAVEIPAFAGSTLADFTGKDERSKSSGRRTWSRAVWLGLMFIGATVASLGVQPVRASTSLYDVQFSSGGLRQTGAPVIGSAGDTWNVMATHTGSSVLLDSAGILGTVSIAWSADGIYNFASSFGGGNASLMGGYIYTSSSHGISFSGLPASQPYTLYIYSQSDASGRELSITVDGTTYTTTPSAFPTNFVAGQNYLTITGMTDSGGNISFTFNMAIGEGNLNGIQLSIANVAPSITSQSASQTISAGETATMSVIAAGTGPLRYQWVKDGRIIAGATDSLLNLSYASVTNSGVYYVVVTNAYGLNISQPVTVAVGNPQLLAWGKNANGQLGDGTSTDKLFPESVASNVVTAAAGASHSLYVNSDNVLWAMGNNANGQLGDGTTASRSYAVSVASNVVAVAAGANHSLFLKSDGTLWAMGFNGDGQFGDGTWTDKHSPESVASNVVAMASGANHSLFLKSDGTLWAMGYNYDGELGDGTTANRNTPVAVLGGNNVVAVAAGSGVTLFVKSDGTLWAIGYNLDGELGDGTYTNRSTPVAVLNGVNAAAAAAGANHSLFLKHDGTLWSMGDGQFGELGNGTNNFKQTPPESVASNVVAVAAGADHSLYLKNDGTLWTMGRNYNGQLGDGTVLNRSNAVPIVGLALGTVVSGCVANHTLAIGLGLPPVITSQPASQMVAAGSPVSFTVTAGGMAPLSYQWQFNGTNLVNATNVSYTLASVALSNAGDYTVVVTNLHGSTISTPATLTVNQPTAVVTGVANPTDAGSVAGGGVYFIGSNAVLTATASNNWQFTSWNDDTTNNPYVITTPATNITYTANFAATAAIAVEASPNDGGYVTGGGTFLIGSTNLISATASNNWVFAGWSDGNTNNFYSIVVVSNLTLTANFSPAATVTTSAMPSEGGATAGDGIYAIDSSATVTATAANGWMFLNWNHTITNNPLNFVVTPGTTNYEAYFVPVSSVTGLANPTNAGSVSGGGVYVVGTNVELTATASNNWLFISWNDGTTNNPYLITVPETNSSYIATFTAAAAITVTASPVEGGSVTGSGTFPIGSTNWCSATASNSWAFVGWSDGSTINPYAIVVESNLTLTAEFAPTVTVTGLANPTNAGSVTGGGIYFVGSNTVLTATASNNWQFVCWNDGATNNPYTVTVPETNVTYTATFAATATLTVNASPVEGGSVTGGGTFLVGSTNFISATPSNGWAFVTWSDGSTLNPYAIVVETNLTLTAEFAPAVTVTVTADPTNAGSVTGGGVLIIGSNTVLTATASNNWLFVCWNDGATNNPYTVTVPETNVTYTATFAATATLTVNASPIEGGSVVGGGTFLVGSTNLLTAVASTNWIFTGWSDGTTRNPYGIVATTNRTYTANFVPAATVTVIFNPANAAAVVTGDGVHPIGSDAVLTATVLTPTPSGSNRWKFLNWNGTVTNYTKTGNPHNPLTFTVTANTTVTANFAQVTSDGFVYTYIRVKAKSPIIKGITVRPMIEQMVEGIEIIGYEGDATRLIIPSHIDGVSVNEIGPEALTGEKFDYVGFEDDVSDITLDGTSIDTAELDFANIADFDGLLEAGEIVIEAGAMEEGGQVLIAGGLAVGALDILADIFSNLAIVSASSDPHSGGHTTGSGLYFKDTPVLLTARANSGWRFNGWSDGSNTNKHWVTAPYTVTADFVPVSTVTVVANPEDGGLVSGGGTYDVGYGIILTATNNLYWKFMEWSDGYTNAIHPITVPAYDITYTATFEELKLEVEAEAGPSIGGVAPGFTTGSGEYGLLDAVTITATPVLPNWKFNKWVLKVAGVPLDSHLFTNSSPVPSVLLFMVTPEMLGLKLTVDADFSTDVEVTTAANPPYAGSVEGEGSCEWPPVMDNLPLVTATPADGWAFTGWDSPVTTNNPSNPFCPILDMVTPFDFTVTANFTPTRLTTHVSGDLLTLDWPMGCILQAQTNALSTGLAANWFDLPGTGDTNSMVIPMDPANQAVFYRLRLP